MGKDKTKTFICEKGHKIKMGSNSFMFIFLWDDDVIAHTKQLCPVCLAEFLDKNIPKVKEESK